jgi:hypothetical protein
MNLTYDALKRIDSGYNSLRALLLIILIRFSKSQSDKQKYKMQLFEMMAKVIVKNIENFWYLAKPHKYAHHIIETSELISECYIALEISIKNFGAKKTGNVRYNVFQIKPNTVDEYIYHYSTGLDFYFYYNKTLTQRLNRIVQKTLATNCIPSDSFLYLKNRTINNRNNTFVDVGILIEAGFSPQEVIYAVLKCKGYNNTEIAKKCSISYSTIVFINANAKEKMINFLMTSDDKFFF